MTDVWLTSDTHYFHANILKFTADDGKLIRPGFDNVDQMNDFMVTKWNERVKPNDHYINVCVEHTGYAPVHIDEIAARVKKLS